VALMTSAGSDGGACGAWARGSLMQNNQAAREGACST